MKVSHTTRNRVLFTVSYLYILLFVYAAVSKLIDFENFQAQIGQSPLLSVLAAYVSVGVIILEISIAIMLAVPYLRIAGLYMAFTLMVIFTVYIYLILNYSSFVPCSCGGILENMGWKEHLIFNIAFAVLAAGAILLPSQADSILRAHSPMFKSNVL